MLSIDCQTNEESARNIYEDVPVSSRIELLRLLLAVLFESVEEDGLLSSKPRTQRENVSLVQYQSNSSFPWERFLVKSQQVTPFAALFCL